MKLTILINLCISFLILSCSSTKTLQTDKIKELTILEIQTDTQNVALLEKCVGKYERLQQNIHLTEGAFPAFKNYKMALPLIFKRQETGFLPMQAEYFYSEPDLKIRYVSYDWERGRPVNLDKMPAIWREESKKLPEYNQEYERIKIEVIKKFGTPTSQDNKPQIKKHPNYKELYYLVKESIWENDKFYAKLYMAFGSPNYMIRLYYYWK
jgi:hypothetical protein